jgi:large subunit ribosomal protein L9
MRVILRENIENLGKKGDIVKVAPGYGRNFLIPKKMAVEVTPTNAKMIAIEQAALQKGFEQEMSTYNELIQRLNHISLSFIRKASEKDVIFGSVSSTDIRDALEDLGFNIEKKKIILDEPIKRLGHFTVPVKVFHEERAEIKIEVVKEGAPKEETKVEEIPVVKEEMHAEPAVEPTEEAAPEVEKAKKVETEELPVASQEVAPEAESKEAADEVEAEPEESPAKSQGSEQEEKTTASPDRTKHEEAPTEELSEKQKKEDKDKGV